MDNAEQKGYSSKGGSEPAYPVVGIRESENSLKLYGQMFHGITKREHFAAMAMQGMIRDIREHGECSAVVAELSVCFADALLKALEK